MIYLADRYCNRDFAKWYDKNRWSCDDYAVANWCSINAQYGTDWREEWGKIEDNSEHRTAWNCPQCGCLGL